jgi:hypothetical protein
MLKACAARAALVRSWGGGCSDGSNGGGGGGGDTDGDSSGGTRTSQQSKRNLTYKAESAPPIASTISLHNFIGGGNGFGSRPKM